MDGRRGRREDGRVAEGAPSGERDLAHLRRLRRLLARSGSGASAYADEELLELGRLQRHAFSVVARLEGQERRPRLAAEARRLVVLSHGLVHRPAARSWREALARGVRLVLEDAPRTIRAEWKLLTAIAVFFYGLAAVAFATVARDLDRAPSLLSPAVVEAEIEQLRDTPPGAPFRGNFEFGFEEAPQSAGMIMFHNMWVGIVIFSAALVPPVFLWVVASNALMVGTYVGVADHWEQSESILSILVCHGTIELQTLLLASAAGLCLVRAWVRPGRHTRRHALELETRRALALLVPVFPLLVVAGLIEGFVSPMAPAPARLAVAAASAVGLGLWVGMGGRRRRDAG